MRINMFDGKKDLSPIQKEFMKIMKSKIDSLNNHKFDLDFIFNSTIKYNKYCGVAPDEILLTFLLAANFDFETACDYEMTYRRITEINEDFKSYIDYTL